jgi:4-hydroxybenzoate polyprenyltransferase
MTFRAGLAPSSESALRPLVVDLDGTLVRTDLLLESVLMVARQSLYCLLLLPWWLLHGKARMKHELARRVTLDATILPYNLDLLEFLRQESSRGRRLILASASNWTLARPVFDHVGLFGDLLASDNRVNLSGKRKLAAIRSLLGNDDFDYAGNDRIDLEIWRHARGAIVVDAGSSTLEVVRASGKLAHTFVSRPRSYPFLRAMRCHQWLKNLLLFVPLGASHRLDATLLVAALLAFVAFSACASAAYLANDLLDLSSDRQHRSKRNRPLASGDLSLLSGMLGVPVLLLVAAAAAMWLPAEFALLLGVYVVTSTAYSMLLKRLIVLDVLTLAGLYTLRIVAGAAAIAVEPSFWLLAFSMFLFLSLALIKRHSELLLVKNDGRETAAGRGYTTADLPVVAQMGIGSGLLAVLVLALYIDSEDVAVLYSEPRLIWFLCPVMLYWVCRMWLLAARGQVDEDPVVFAAKDRRTYLLGLVCIVVLWLAI